MSGELIGYGEISILFPSPPPEISTRIYLVNFLSSFYFQSLPLCFFQLKPKDQKQKINPVFDLTSSSNYHHTSQLSSLPNFMWKYTCPGPVLNWWECHPTYRKVADSIPSQGTYSGCRFNHSGKATNQCFLRGCFYKLLRNFISSPPTHHSIHYYKAFFFVHHTNWFYFLKSQHWHSL